MQVDLREVNQSDVQGCTSACNVHWSRGQKENNRSLGKAGPASTALSHFHWLDALQSPPFLCGGTSACLVLLNTTTAVQCPQQQVKMKKCVSSQIQEWAKHRAWKIPLIGKSKWMHVLLRCTKKKRGKRATCKRKDKTNVERGSEDPSHTQANKLSCIIHGLCSQGWVHLFQNVLLDSKLQHCPRVKIKGSSWGARSVYMLNSTRGVWDFIFSDFRGQILIQGTVTLNWV